VVVQNVIFSDGQIKIEDIEKLSLDSANITFSENTGAQGPVNVF